MVVKTQPQQQQQRSNPIYVALVSLLVGFVLGRMGGEGGGTSLTTVCPTVPSPSEQQRALEKEPTGKEGWKSIEIYCGNHQFLLEESLKGGMSTKKSFSQEGQDLYVLELLKYKKNGFFVDLASNHAIKLSNTFVLEHQYDWTGICIEPNWQYWNGLVSLRPNCKVVGAVVGGGGKSGEAGAAARITFRFHPFKRFMGAMGGIVGSEFDNKPNAKNTNEFLEETRFLVSLEEILRRNKAPSMIDYLSLDVEGAEELILQSFPFHNPYTFRVMNIERPSNKITNLLKSNGYQLMRTDKYGDTIWKHSSLNV